MTHLTSDSYNQSISVPLETGDTLLLDGTVFGEITSVTNGGIVRHEYPVDGGSEQDSIGKAALQQKIKEANEVTIR